MRTCLQPILTVVAASFLHPFPAQAQALRTPWEETRSAVDPSTSGQATAEPGGPRRLFGDIARDYRNFISWESAAWLTGGGISAVWIHLADEQLRDATQDEESAVVRTMNAGGTGAAYGNLSFQVPLAVAWWAIGHAAGNARGADAGRDLLRGQISALGWAYAFKYAADRTRPNGDPRSFPSGHATATFATAMVLQEHYGWKVGLPFFAASTLTAASRITVNKHWASDVVFGAYLGMAAGRTVTLHVRGRRLALSPLPVPGGAGVTVRVGDRASPHAVGTASRHPE